MAKKRINVYWLLLLVLMYTASILLSIGRTQARFDDTASVATLVGSQQVEVTSNCLVTAQDPSVTVLGGRMSLITSTKLSFWLRSTGADAVGVLRWGVQDPDHAQYLKITMQSGADVISPEAEIDLLEDVPMELTMTLTPTETARNTVHEEMKIYVLVTWGDRMWGTFQVILPEVKDKTEPEETLPEETEPEGTEPEGTEPEGTEPEGTEPEGTEPEGTEPEGTESDGTESEGTESEGTESEGTESGGTESGGTESDETESDGTESDGTESDGTESDGTESDGTESDGTESDGTESDGTESDGTESDGTESDGTESGGTESDGTESDGTESDGTESDGAESDGTETGGTKSDGTESEGTESEGTESDGTESDGTETDGTKTDGTESDGTESDGTESDGTETDGTETDGTETDGTETDGTETDGTESDGTESDGTESDGTESDGTESDGTETDGTESDGTETDGTETEETEPTTELILPEEEGSIRLETLSRFDAAGMLPVNVVLTENVTSVRIGLGQINSELDEDPENPVAQVLPLPNRTRFSLDGGENFYMLYEGNVVELDLEGMTSFMMLLDLRYTGMEVGTGFLLAMDAYVGEEAVANSFERTICGTTKPVKSAVYDKEAYQKWKQQTAASEEEAVTLKKQGSYVLNQNTVLELTMPEEWQEAEMTYSLEFLTMAEDKTLEYQPVNLKTSGLYAESSAEAEKDTKAEADTEEETQEGIRTDTLVLGIGDTLPRAGTYRINMEWTYEGVCYAKKQITFFINYAASQVFAE